MNIAEARNKLTELEQLRDIERKKGWDQKLIWKVMKISYNNDLERFLNVHIANLKEAIRMYGVNLIDEE